MPKDVIYEIFVRKGDAGGPFTVTDQETIKQLGEMCAIAKAMVDKGEVDEAVVLEKRVIKRFKKYHGEG